MFSVLKANAQTASSSAVSVESCGFPPAARLDVGDTIWKGERGRERKRGDTQKSITFGSVTNLPGFFRVTISVPQSPNTGKSSAIQYKRLFSKKKKFSILLVKQSLRTSKMATRNTSSSDAPSDRSSAHLVCDWTAVAAPALLFVKAYCQSREAGFTPSCLTLAMIGPFGRVKGQTDFCFGRKVFWEMKLVLVPAK